MTSLAKYIKENAAYTGESSAGALEQLNDDQFTALCGIMSECGLDPEPGLAGDLTITAETIDDFNSAKEKWSECQSSKTVDGFSYPAMYFEGVQVLKGHERKEVIVIDVGDKRVVVIF